MNQTINQVVVRFYERATTDMIIGYHFRHIEDFGTHIPRIVAFWEIQLLGKSSSEITKPFDLIQIHKPLKIKKGEVGRWIIIFKEVLAELNHEMDENLEKLWQEKLEKFRIIFLESPQLF